MDRIRHLSDIPSMPRYSAGKINTAELEAAVHVAPTPTDTDSGKTRGNGNGRRLSNASCSGSSSAASIGAGSGNLSDESNSGANLVVLLQLISVVRWKCFCRHRVFLCTHVFLFRTRAFKVDGAKGSKSRHRRSSMRHGIGVKGGRRGSMAIDKSWEAINKVKKRKKKRPLPEVRRPSSAQASNLSTAAAAARFRDGNRTVVFICESLRDVNRHPLPNPGSIGRQARAQADGGVKQKQLNNIRRRMSNVGTQPQDLKPFKVRESFGTSVPRAHRFFLVAICM